MLLVQLLSSMGALMLLTIVIVLCLFRVRRQKRQLEVNCKKYLSIIHQEHPHSLVGKECYGTYINLFTISY